MAARTKPRKAANRIHIACWARDGWERIGPTWRPVLAAWRAHVAERHRRAADPRWTLKRLG